MHALGGIGEVEGDATEFHVSAHVLEFARTGRLLALLNGILQPVEVLKFGTGLEDLGRKLAHLVEAADEKSGKAGKGDDVADLELAVLDEKRADDEDHQH